MENIKDEPDSDDTDCGQESSNRVCGPLHNNNIIKQEPDSEATESWDPVHGPLHDNIIKDDPGSAATELEQESSARVHGPLGDNTMAVISMENLPKGPSATPNKKRTLTPIWVFEKENSPQGSPKTYKIRRLPPIRNPSTRLRRRPKLDSFDTQVRRNVHRSPLATSAVSIGSTPSTPSSSLTSSSSESSEETSQDHDIADYKPFGSEDESGTSDEEFGDYAWMRIRRKKRTIADDDDDDDDDDEEEDDEEDEDDDAPPFVPENFEIFSPETYDLDFYDFQWTLFSNSSILPEPRRDTFTHKHGATTALSDPYDLFMAIWDREFVLHIVTQTNLYAKQMVENSSYHPQSIAWVDTSIDEIYLYFGIVLAMGVAIRMRPEDYWRDDLFGMPGFLKVISLQRFKMLTKMLHFNNNKKMCTQNMDSSDAKLFKILPVITHLNSRFSSMYEMRQNLTMNQYLLKWKPNKSSAGCLKCYELCESKTGYLWRFEVPSYRSMASSDLLDPLSEAAPAAVLRLIQGLEYRGHTLCMDNHFNSPPLARKLKTLGFDCFGRLKLDRDFIPTNLIKAYENKMKPGHIVGYTSGDVDVMVCCNVIRVATISTYHRNAACADNGNFKDTLIRNFNSCMKVLAVKDQMLSIVPFECRRSKIWYKKLFFRLLNMSTLNAYIIHKQSRAATVLSHDDFRKQLFTSLIDRHKFWSAQFEIERPNASSRPNKVSHLPGKYPKLPISGTRRRQCVVCKHRTPTYCMDCDKAVCLTESCYLNLHTM